MIQELPYKNDNDKLFDEHLKFMDLLLKGYTPHIPKQSNYVAVLFELRSHDKLRSIVKNHMFFLNNSENKIKWSLQIFHGIDNEEYVKNILGDIENIFYTNLNIKNISDRTEHTKILKTRNFWESIIGEKVLLFQTDSMLLRTGIEEFLNYDYIGGPWAKPKEGTYVGNGGLSLRTKSKMIEIIDNHPYHDDMLEDIFFSKYMVDKNIADVETSKKFSMEDTYYHNPFGIHRPHKIETSLLKKLFEENVLKYSI